MKITKLILERFKQFKKTTINLGDINILAGPNNSGKTTILWALKVFFYFTKKSLYVKNDQLEFGRHYVHAMDFMPIPSDDELWYNKDSRQTVPVKITIQFDNNWTGTLVLTNRFGQIHVDFKSSELPTGISADQIDKQVKKEVAFVPGVVGVLVQEVYSAQARQVSLAAEGRYAEIFRSSLYRLADAKPTALKKINEFLEKNLNVKLLKPKSDPDKHEFVISKYRENDKEFDIVAGGSGFHQIIQIFVNLLVTKPSLVLFDEPDAHLHPSTQGTLASAVEELKGELNAQILVATHSYDIIDYYDLSKILLVTPTADTIERLQSEQDKYDKLKNAGIISNSALVRLFAAKACIILEDEIIDVFKAFDRKLKTKIFKSNTLRSARGVSKFGIQKDIIDATSSIVGQSINPLFVQDRDGLPDDYIDDLNSLAQQEGMKLVFLERHEIENYLVEPALLRKVLMDKGHDVSSAEIKTLIKNIINENKYEWLETIRGRVRALNNILNNQLTGRDQKNATQAGADVDRYADNIGNDFKRMVAFYPGKELLKAIRHNIDEQYNVSFSNIELIDKTTATISKELKQIFNEINNIS
jgi:AAA15 family ATPase/GTPase